jgi:hypothetical protein
VSAVSVFPVPLGPAGMKTPTGRLGLSISAARLDHGGRFSRRVALADDATFKKIGEF